MFRRITVLASVTSLVFLMSASPAGAIIHELVGSHCAGSDLPNNSANVDPPGQFNTQGNSFARALQATGIYTFLEGVDQAGELGLDLTTDPPTFGPLPGPGDDLAVTVVVDTTRRSAKVGGDFVWFYFVDDETFGEPVHIYVQVYELDHPAFEHCAALNP